MARLKPCPDKTQKQVLHYVLASSAACQRGTRNVEIGFLESICVPCGGSGKEEEICIIAERPLGPLPTPRIVHNLYTLSPVR